MASPPSTPQGPFASSSPTALDVLIGENFTRGIVLKAGRHVISPVSSVAPVALEWELEGEEKTEKQIAEPSLREGEEANGSDKEGEDEKEEGHAKADKRGWGKIVGEPQPKPFSIWGCLVNPKECSDPSNSRGYAVLRLSISRCEAHALIRGRENRRNTPPSEGKLPTTDEDDEIPLPASVPFLPYLVASLNGQRMFRSRVVTAEQHFVWDEVIELQVHHPRSILGLELFDRDFGDVGVMVVEKERLGAMTLPIWEMKPNVSYDTTLELYVHLPPAMSLQSGLAAASATLAVREVEPSQRQTATQQQEHEDAASAMTGEKSLGTASSRGGGTGTPASPASPYPREEQASAAVVEVPGQNVHLGAKVTVALITEDGWLGEVAALMLPVPKQSGTLPPLDARRLYASAMRIRDLAWNRLFRPTMEHWEAVRSWKNIGMSSAVGLLLVVQILHPDLLFATTCAAIAVVLAVNKVMLAPVPRGRLMSTAVASPKACASPSEESPDRSRRDSPDTNGVEGSFAMSLVGSAMSEEVVITLRRCQLMADSVIALLEDSANFLRGQSPSSTRAIVFFTVASIVGFVYPKLVVKVLFYTLVIIGAVFFSYPLPIVNIPIRLVNALGVALTFSKVRRDQSVNLHTIT